MFIADRPGDLTGIERRFYVVINRRVECLGEVVVLTKLGIRGGEKPELVLLNRATDVAAYILFGKTVRRRTGVGKILHSTHQSLRREESEKIAMNVVAAAF